MTAAGLARAPSAWPAIPASHASIAGAGVGLRTPHIRELLSDADALEPQYQIPWLELLADNWLAPSAQPLGGLNESLLMALAERYPLTLHGVGLSLGSCGELDFHYLQAIKALRQRTRAGWYSEHCSFSWLPPRTDRATKRSELGQFAPDLLPLPYTEEAVALLVKHIDQVQNFLGERILLENVSTYVQYQHSQLSEAEFMSAVVEQADCYLLLDINNVYVTGFNGVQDVCQGQLRGDNNTARAAAAVSRAALFLQHLPHQRVKEIHLAGHQLLTPQANDGATLLLDSHSQAIGEPVWTLYEQYIAAYGGCPTLIEWDSELPTLRRLNLERLQAENILTGADSLCPKL